MYVSDEEPGFTRKKRGRGFSYFHPDGKMIRNESLRERFNALVIPPAWTDVWICVEPNGHILATGRDDADRKQYIYHPEWEEMQNEAKFERVYEFGKTLPKIREKVDEDLRKHNLPQQRVLALVVALLDETHIRIGSSIYTEKNGSYGLTTLQNGHAEVNSKRVVFEFVGKSGVEQSVDLNNPRLARILKACQELPGQSLFQYKEDDGEVQTVDSDDVNAYIREIIGEDFSAKDFRTWAGTVAAVEALKDLDLSESKNKGEKNIVEAVKQVAEKLGNTPAVCRKYYIHPAILDSYLSGDLNKVSQKVAKQQKDKEDLQKLNEVTVERVLKNMGYGSK